MDYHLLFWVIVGAIIYFMKLLFKLCLTINPRRHPIKITCFILALLRRDYLARSPAVNDDECACECAWMKLSIWSLCTLILIPVFGLLLVLPATFVFSTSLLLDDIPPTCHLWIIPTKGATIETVFCNSTASNRWVVGFPGNLATYTGYVSPLSTMGELLDSNVLLVNHRGTGRGTGTFVESGQLVSDAQMVVEALMERFNVKEEDLILYGQSVSGPVVAKLPFYKSAYLIDRSFSKPSKVVSIKVTLPTLVFLLYPMLRVLLWVLLWLWKQLNVLHQDGWDDWQILLQRLVRDPIMVFEDIADEIITKFERLSRDFPPYVRHMLTHFYEETEELTRELAEMLELSQPLQLGLFVAVLITCVACVYVRPWGRWLSAHNSLEVIVRSSILFTAWDSFPGLPLDQPMFEDVGMPKKLLIIFVLSLLIDSTDNLLIGYGVELNTVNPLVDKIKRGVSVGVIYVENDNVIPYPASTHYGLVSERILFNSIQLSNCPGNNPHMVDPFLCKQPEQLGNWLQKLLL